MNTPIAIISNDWHLNEKNGDLLLNVIRQKCELAKKLKIDTVFALGDLFHSRIAQRLVVLKNFERILDVFKEFNINLVAIHGNHDLSDYTSSESFLEPFKHHPNFELISDYDDYEIADGVTVHLMPFFKEEIWKEKFKEVEKHRNIHDIVFTHIGVQGSKNNDGSDHESIIKVSDFKDFDKVFSGHFHNQQQVGKNFFHLPSIIQHNYGEDWEKGFTILYDDLSHELHHSVYPKYEKIILDLDKLSKKELNEVTQEYTQSDSTYVRFEFVGSKSKVDSIDKAFYQNLGIDVQKKVKDIEETSIEYTEEVKVYTDSSLKESFKEFCIKEELEYEQGIKYMQV